MLGAGSWQPQKLKMKCFMCRLLHAWSSWRILRQDGSSAWAHWRVEWHNTTTSGSSAFKWLSITLKIIIIMRTWPTSNVCENFLAAGFSFRYQSEGVTASYSRNTHVPWITVIKNYHPLYSLNAWLWYRSYCIILFRGFWWLFSPSYLNVHCTFRFSSHWTELY